jgi:SAM-dependent methyltransferase
VTDVNIQEQINRSVYHAPGVDQEYTSWTLTRAEVSTLLKYQHAFCGRDVLDLGVGTGRTAVYLAPLARQYEGIDYSPVMLDRIHRELPSVSAHLVDLADLSEFPSESFDFVFGSNNVLDAVSHEHRLSALAGLSRILRDEGVLVFSSHNREYCEALRGPRIARSRNPITQLSHVARWARRMRNHARVRALRTIESEFAILNDEGHDFACLHYYIDQRAQRRQLSQFGFRVIEVLDHEGRTVSEDEPTDTSPWLMYVAEKTRRA